MGCLLHHGVTGLGLKLEGHGAGRFFFEDLSFIAATEVDMMLLVMRRTGWAGTKIYGWD